MRDLYSVLKLSRRASSEDIKFAYRALAKQFHPDVNAGDEEADRWTKEINRAYEVLGDPSGSEENVEAFLSEVLIVSQDVDDSLLSHYIHRDAICQAITFIVSCLIQSESGWKCINVTRRDYHGGRRH